MLHLPAVMSYAAVCTLQTIYLLCCKQAEARLKTCHEHVETLEVSPFIVGLVSICNSVGVCLLSGNAYIMSSCFRLASGFALFQAELRQKAEIASQERLKCNKVCTVQVYKIS